MPGRVQDKVCVVTGGASGIGLATATLFQEQGARVAALDLNPPAIKVDVTDDASVRQGIAEAAEELGGIDILVNNAGIGAQGTVEDNDDDEWRRVFDVNVFGMARVARAALPHLRRSEHAAIVLTASVAATEEVFTIAPPPDSRRCGSAARATRVIPRTLTSKTRRHSSSSLSSTVPCAPMPALLTSTSSPPSDSTADVTAARTAASSATSART